MPKKRRSINVFSLTFLDAMTCGLGAVILLYLIINATVRQEKNEITEDLKAEVNKLEELVLEGQANLVELRNSVDEADRKRRVTQGLSQRLLETLKITREELATYEQSTLARKEHLNKLITDVKTLEEKSKRLSASIVSDETPGDRIREHIGDGDRQYLTGLKVGGKRILVLMDTSASMLDETIVNIVRMRNMSDEQKRLAPKWTQAVNTLDWISTQMPRDAYFQVHTFGETTAPILEGTQSQWLNAGDPEQLKDVIEQVRKISPGGGTSLHLAFDSIKTLSPRPDNIILLTDGLPTMGLKPEKSRTISSKKRLRLFNSAVDRYPRNIPLNTILLPMEGDPLAAAAFWKLTKGTKGSLLSPSEDWP